MNSRLAGATAEITDAGRIQQVVKSFIMQRAKENDSPVQIEFGDKVPPIRLPACGNPLHAFLPEGHRLSGYTSIGVRCDGPRPWSIYVRAHIRSFGKVLVSKRAVARGTQLTKADVGVEQRDLGSLSAVPLTDPSQAVGKLARRSIGMGLVLTGTMLKQPRLVRRGQQVTIIAVGPGLSVRASGEALEDGVEADSIRVRNSLTKKIIFAVVTEPGTVRIEL